MYSSGGKTDAVDAEPEQVPEDVARIIESQKRVRDAFADFIDVWKAKRLADETKNQSHPKAMGLFKRKSA